MDGQTIWYFIPPQMQFGQIYTERVVGEFNGVTMIAGYDGVPRAMAGFHVQHPTERAAKMALASRLRELAASLVTQAEEHERVAVQEVVEV